MKIFFFDNMIQNSLKYNSCFIRLQFIFSAADDTHIVNSSLRLHRPVSSYLFPNHEALSSKNTQLNV